MKILLCLFFPLFLSGQTQKVFRLDTGYYIPRREDFKEFEYLARTGKTCLKQVDTNLAIIAQMQESARLKDSVKVRIQKEIYDLKQFNIERETAMAILAKQNMEQARTITDLKSQLKILKWQVLGFKITIGASLALGTYLILK